MHMQKVIVSYSIPPDRKIKARLLAQGMGKTMSRFISDLVDESWRRQARRLKVDKVTRGYRRDVKRLIRSLVID